MQVEILNRCLLAAKSSICQVILDGVTLPNCPSYLI